MMEASPHAEGAPTETDDVLEEVDAELEEPSLDSDEDEDEDEEELSHDEELEKARNDVKGMRKKDDDEDKDDGEGSYSASDISKLCGTDPKSFRKWLRGLNYGVGQGGRYLFSEAEKDDLVEKYNKKGTAKGTKPAEKGKGPRKRAATKVIDLVEEDEEDEDGPDDEELASIDDLEDLEDED
jgi:hypothetical protein